MDSGVFGLSCRNFRSYGTLSLSFNEPFVVFIGENGAGKTNILEAISLFASGRGLRKASISDLNNLAAVANSWNLELNINVGGCRSFLSTNARNGRRVAKIDGSLVGSLSKFEDLLWLLWVIPSMGSLFIGDSQDRRKFFDHLVSGFENGHKKRLKVISNLQKERLHIILFRKDESWLKIVEQRLAEESIIVIRNRLNFIQMLSQTFENYPSNFLRPQIEILGIIEDIFANNDEESAKKEIAAALSCNRSMDAERQVTQVSVHKTFWKAIHSKTGVEAGNCSTGEQKAFLISLVLAATRIYRDGRTGVPILLLDDLMMHLDRSNRGYLIDELFDIGVQTFFTGTDDYLFEHMNNSVQRFSVKKSICQQI